MPSVTRPRHAPQAETVAFIDSIESKADAPVTGEDGVIALAMAIAAGLSAKEQRWVKLSEVLPALDGSMEGGPRLRKRDRLSAFLRSLGGARTSEPEPIPA